MRSRFVSFRNGQRSIHWPKLVAFSAVAVILTSGLLEGFWYLVAGSFSPGALVVGLVLSLLVVVRTIARAVTYQEEELGMTIGSP
jgi:hypothetical protein